MTPEVAERAVLAGGSGFIGTRLAADLTRRGYQVVRVGRAGPDVRWDDPDGLARSVDGAAVVINLAGRSVGCRYTDRNRQMIYDSRITTTRALSNAIASASAPPPLWLNASTATIYRYAMDRPQTETDGELGRGFSVDVARDWEQALFADDLGSTRRIAMRMAIVLGDGPALGMLARAARLGLGGAEYDGSWLPHRRYRGIGPTPTDAATTGHHSHGRQRFSWIHLDDLSSAIRFMINHDELDGPVNLAAPHAGTNRGLMAALRRAVRAPVGLSATRWMLEPALWVLRQESELLLKSRWVTPAKLTAAGFTFDWNDLDPAIDDLVAGPRRQRPSSADLIK